MAATINSLQMGFRTLAIEKRSSEAWAVLGAVKTEFGSFRKVLAATKRQCKRSPGPSMPPKRALARWSGS